RGRSRQWERPYALGNDMYQLIASALALGLMAAAGYAVAAPVKANVAQGVVVGEPADGIAVFRGIPFAAPPVGDLRWKPPQAPARWTGDKAATQFGPTCMQGARPAGPTMSEDCLYLNINAPAGAKNAPVMVWIHGGSNTSGSG